MMNLTGKILACIAGGVAVLGYVPRAVGQTIYVPGGTVGTTSTSNVGIGTPTPQAKLDVGGLVRVTGNTPVPTSGPGLELSANSLVGAVEAYNRGVGPMPLYLYGTPVCFPEGNVGIGTTTPVQKLDVNGFLALGGTSFASYSSGNINVYSSSGAFNVYNNAGTTALLTALNTGAVGIGTTSPGYKLDVHNDDYNAIRAAGSSSNSIAVFVENDISGGRQWAIASSGGGPSPLGSFVVWDGTAGTPRMVFDTAGNVGIGTTNPTQKLSVNGTIRAKEVVVDTGWSDYVFDDSYRLAPLSEVEQRIKADKHLPGIPSAQEVAEHGVTLGEMQSKLLAKIEELTLHVIEQEKRIAKLEAENTALRNR